MTLPLAPYTVIDLTRARSGPTCVRQLADMGARVIQVSAREDVEGDFPRRGFDSQNLHRNKRSITLDLKSPQGIDILKRLVATRNRTALTAEIEKALARRPSHEWVDLLNAKGVPSGPILNVQEVYENEQVRHLGMAVPVQHPALGEIRVQAPPLTLSRTPASVRLHAPDAGEHTGEILGELGFSRDDIARLREAKVV